MRSPQLTIIVPGTWLPAGAHWPGKVNGEGSLKGRANSKKPNKSYDKANGEGDSWVRQFSTEPGNAAMGIPAALGTKGLCAICDSETWQEHTSNRKWATDYAQLFSPQSMEGPDQTMCLTTEQVVGSTDLPLLFLSGLCKSSLTMISHILLYC